MSLKDVRMDGDDLYIGTHGETEVVEGVVANRQRIQNRLSIVRGELFWSPLFGLPYFGDILGSKETEEIVGSLVAEQILSAPTISRLTNPVEATYDASTRDIALSFEAITEDGDPVTVTDLEIGG